MHPGCAIQLAYKILLDCNLHKPEKSERGFVHQPVPADAWITSLSTARHFRESENLTQVYNPPAAGAFCFMDDETAFASLSELLAKASAFIICLNLSGKIQFARDLGMRGYAATASPAFYEDMTMKIRKAAAMKGMRFIEVIAPCPSVWKNEPSNTVELCRQVVNIGMWPLFEIEKGSVTMNHKPHKLENKSAFEGMQKKMRVDEQHLEKNWKKFLLKPYEAEI